MVEKNWCTKILWYEKTLYIRRFDGTKHHIAQVRSYEISDTRKFDLTKYPIYKSSTAQKTRYTKVKWYEKSDIWKFSGTKKKAIFESSMLRENGIWKFGGTKKPYTKLQWCENSIYESWILRKTLFTKVRRYEKSIRTFHGMSSPMYENWVLRNTRYMNVRWHESLNYEKNFTIRKAYDSTRC